MKRVLDFPIGKWNDSFAFSACRWVARFAFRHGSEKTAYSLEIGRVLYLRKVIFCGGFLDARATRT